MKRALVATLCSLLSLPAVADPYYPQPHGHADLLERQPELVFRGWESWAVDMDLLRRVNRQVNASMSYRPEHQDAWGRGADCEDFALRKLQALLSAGVPRGALRLAVARAAGRGHAVLVVRGYWILDSLHDEVLSRNQAGSQLAAWETVGGKWNPASGFASLADHLRSLTQQRSLEQAARPSELAAKPQD